MTSSQPAVERVHPPDALIRLANPVTRRLIGRGVAGNQLFVLHYTGRRTGLQYDVPAGYHLIAGVPSVLTNSRWRHNFAGGREIEVTLRGERRPARAVLVDDPQTVADVYDQLIRKFGVKQAQRRFGVRVNVPRAPTTDELREMIERSGLSIVRIELRE